MESSLEFCKNCKREVSAANFASHSAFCERKIKLCELCNEPVQITGVEAHLNEYHAPDRCNKCDLALEKWMLPKHQVSCPKRLVPCDICQAEFPFDEYPEHKDFCGSRTEKCIICGKFVMIREQEMHNELHFSIKESQMSKHTVEAVQNSINELINVSRTPLSDASKFNSPNNEKRNSSQAVHKKAKQNSEIGSSVEAGAFISDKPKVFNTKKDTLLSDDDMHRRYQNRSEIRSLMGATSLKKESEALSIKKNTHSDDIRTQHHSEIRSSIEASASSSKKSENYSKHYGTCLVCKKDIPWIDMNTHLPICATDAGKCSRCGEDVPGDNIKDHIMKHCRKLSENAQRRSVFTDTKISKLPHDNSDNARFDLAEEAQAMISCPFCKQMYSEDRIIQHTRSCPKKDLYNCPLCDETMPEKEKGMHEGFYCKALLPQDCQIQPSSPFSSSYADVAKPNWHEERQRLQDNSITCPKCRNRISTYRLDQHLETCHRNVKPCKFCKQEIPLQEEISHLLQCPVIKNLNVNTKNSKKKGKHKGAVPKYSKTPDLVKMKACSYCKTTYNADILPFHEEQCISQSIECHLCNATVLIKDFLRHIEEEHADGKMIGKKGKTYDEQKSREKSSGPGPLKKILDYFTKPSEKESYFQQYEGPSSITPLPHGYSQNSYGQYFSNTHYLTGVGPDSYKATEFPRTDSQNDLIPCEFCNEMFPMSELVQHETGCRPELVSYGKEKPHPPEAAKEEKYQSSENSSTFFSSSKMPQRHPKVECRKRNTESRTGEPGEFLQSFDQDTKSESKSPEVLNELATDEDTDEKTSKFSQIESCWNISNSSSLLTRAADHETSLEHVSNDLRLDQMPNYLKRSQEENLDVVKKEVPRKLSSDEEMTAYYDFLGKKANVSIYANLECSNKTENSLCKDVLAKQTMNYKCNKMKPNYRESSSVDSSDTEQMSIDSNSSSSSSSSEVLPKKRKNTQKGNFERNSKEAGETNVSFKKVADSNSPSNASYELARFTFNDTVMNVDEVNASPTERLFKEGADDDDEKFKLEIQSDILELKKQFQIRREKHDIGSSNVPVKKDNNVPLTNFVSHHFSKLERLNVDELAKSDVSSSCNTIGDKRENVEREQAWKSEAVANCLRPKESAEAFVKKLEAKCDWKIHHSTDEMCKGNATGCVNAVDDKYAFSVRSKDLSSSYKACLYAKSEKNQYEQARKHEIYEANQGDEFSSKFAPKYEFLFGNTKSSEKGKNWLQEDKISCAKSSLTTSVNAVNKYANKNLPDLLVTDKSTKNAKSTMDEIKKSEKFSYGPSDKNPKGDYLDKHLLSEKLHNRESVTDNETAHNENCAFKIEPAEKSLSRNVPYDKIDAEMILLGKKYDLNSAKSSVNENSENKRNLSDEYLEKEEEFKRWLMWKDKNSHGGK